MSGLYRVNGLGFRVKSSPCCHSSGHVLEVQNLKYSLFGAMFWIDINSPFKVRLGEVFTLCQIKDGSRKQEMDLI